MVLLSLLLVSAVFATATKARELNSALNDVISVLNDVALDESLNDVTPIKHVEGYIKDIPGSLKVISKSAHDIIGSLEDIPKSSNEVAGSIRKMPKSTNNIEGSLKETPKSANEIVGSLKKIHKSINDNAESLKEIPKSIDDISESLKEIFRPANDIVGPSKSANDITGPSNDVINDFVPMTDFVKEKPLPPKHHKVHNLILNPDQHSWCELKKIRQIVTHANCEPLEMENYVCVGTCFSYSVPRTEPIIPGDEMLDYCDSCQPAESRWTTVLLKCEIDGHEYVVTKNIQLITNCSCSACKPPPKTPLQNDVHQHNHRISELIYKMLPENRPPFEEKQTILDDIRYTRMSLGDLKKEFSLDSRQEKLIKGKLLVKDIDSFKTSEENNNPLKTASP